MRSLILSLGGLGIAAIASTSLWAAPTTPALHADHSARMGLTADLHANLATTDGKGEQRRAPNQDGSGEGQSKSEGKRQRKQDGSGNGEGKGEQKRQRKQDGSGGNCTGEECTKEGGKKQRREQKRQCQSADAAKG